MSVRKIDADRLEPPLLQHGWYITTGPSAAFMGGPGASPSTSLAWFDRTIIDGAVNGVGPLARDAAARRSAGADRLVRTYALGIAIGAVLLVLFVLTRVSCDGLPILHRAQCRTPAASRCSPSWC